MAFDSDFVVPTKRKMKVKDWNSECILPQTQLSSNKWSTTSCKRMAILESLAENNNYIEDSVLGEQSSSLPAHKTSSRINNIFDSLKKKKNSTKLTTGSSRPSDPVIKVSCHKLAPIQRSNTKSVPKLQLNDEDERLGARQKSSERTCIKAATKKAAINVSTNIVKSEVDSIFKPCKNVSKLNSKVQAKPQTPKDLDDIEILDYDSDDDFEIKRSFRNVQKGKTESKSTQSSSRNKINANESIEIFIIDSDEEDVVSLPEKCSKDEIQCNVNLKSKVNNYSRDDLNLISPSKIEPDKCSEDESRCNINLELRMSNYSRSDLSTSEIEIIDITEENYSNINNEITGVYSSTVIHDLDRRCISIEEKDDEDTIEFSKKNTVNTLLIKGEDHSIISNNNQFDTIDFTNYKRQFDSFENWRKQFKYLQSVELVSKDEKCDSVFQFDSLNEIIRIGLFSDHLDHGTYGVFAIDSCLTPKMKLKDDLLLKLIDTLFSVSDKQLKISSYKTLMKMVSLFSWNFDDGLWPYFETVADRLCDKDSSHSIKKTSFRLFKILQFIVSEIGINSSILNNNVLDHGTSLIKVNTIINWISLLSGQHQYFEEYGKPFFQLLKYAVSALEKNYMVTTAAEKMYSIIETLPNVHLRQFVIGLTEPKNLKLQTLSLILEKNEDTELHKPFSHRLTDYFVNAKCFKNFNYSDATVEILERESYEELVFVLNSAVRSFLETVADSSYEDCALAMQCLPSICESFHNFCDRVISSCASIKNYYVFHELDYLINYTFKSYSKNV